MDEIREERREELAIRHSIIEYIKFVKEEIMGTLSDLTASVDRLVAAQEATSGQIDSQVSRIDGVTASLNAAAPAAPAPAEQPSLAEQPAPPTDTSPSGA